MPVQLVKIEKDRTTFWIPLTLKIAIAREAAEQQRPMTDIVTEQLAKRYPNLEMSPTPN